jgi:hypothetical protein
MRDVFAFGKKNHAYAIFFGRRQFNTLLGHLFAIVLIRQLDQNARAVAHQLVGTDRAAMGEILQDEQALLNDRMTFMAFYMGDKTDAAGIMLVGGVVKAVLLGVLDFGFNVVLVLHSALLMDVAGIGQRQNGAFIHRGGGGQECRFGIHYMP